MELEKCKNIVTIAVGVISNLTNLQAKDLRLETFEQNASGDYEVGLSINEGTLFYNRTKSYYVVTLLQEDLTIKKIRREEYEG